MRVPSLFQVAFEQRRTVWSSQLYIGGASPLVKLLNITRKEFRDMCDRVERGKRSPSKYFDVDKNPHLLKNLKLFEFWGLEVNQQKSVVRKYPALASRGTKALMENKEIYNEKFNLSADEWKGVVIRCPRLLTEPREKMFGLLFTAFTTLGLSQKEIKDLFLAAPDVFNHGDLQHVDKVFEVLRDLGLSNEKLIQVLEKCPDMIAGNVAENLKPKLKWLQKEMGLSWGPMITNLLVKDSSMFWESSIAGMKGVHTWLIGQGFTKEECRKVALNLPEVILHNKLREVPRMLPMIKQELGKDERTNMM